MVQTVIGLNSAMMQMPDKKRKQMDYKKELQEIIDQVASAKNRLAEVTEAMDFDDSAAEVDEQDTHQIIVIGVAAIVPHNAMADSLMDDISFFVEENTEAEIIDEEREIR